MVIKEVLVLLANRQVPIAHQQDDIDRVIEVLVQFPHARLIYIVDDAGRLCGTITIGSLLRHLFPHHYNGRIHPRGILRTITATKAMHLMDKNKIVAAPDDTVEDILQRMAATAVKEMAVVDHAGCVVGDITAVDLMRYGLVNR